MTAPFFAVSGLRLRFLPIVAAIVAIVVLMQLCLIPARELARWIFFTAGPASWAAHVGLYGFVWLMEQSRSLVAPIVAHGVGNFVEVGLVMLMMSAKG